MYSCRNSSGCRASVPDPNSSTHECLRVGCGERLAQRMRKAGRAPAHPTPPAPNLPAVAFRFGASAEGEQRGGGLRTFLNTRGLYVRSPFVDPWGPWGRVRGALDTAHAQGGARCRPSHPTRAEDACGGALPCHFSRGQRSGGGGGSGLRAFLNARGGRAKGTLGGGPWRAPPTISVGPQSS